MNVNTEALAPEGGRRCPKQSGSGAEEQKQQIF